MSTTCQLQYTPTVLTLHFSDGSRGEFLSVWLIDNDPQHRDAYSGQRLVDVADLPLARTIHAARVDGGDVLIEWSDSHVTTRVSVEWLHQHRARAASDVHYWLDGAQRNAFEDCAWLSHSAYGNDAAQTATWLRRLVTEGIAFLSAVPTHEGAILAAVAPMGHVIDTNYGRLFDVRAVAVAENLAYTDRGLGLHTDNPYRDPVPGFQALQCLLASTEGGDSLFADGWAVAEHLRATDPESFATLTTTPVPFYYRSAGAELRAERPLIQLTARGVVCAVHYNNRSIAPLQLEHAHLQRFYHAYQRFALLLREPRLQMHLRLRPGDLVVFDNQRILHGRTAFASMREARHLQGCYLSRDSVLSTAAMLNREYRTAC